MTVVLIVTGVLLALASLLLARSHRNKAHALQDAAVVQPSLEAGERCRIGGTVELPEGSEFAISTRLRQHDTSARGETPSWRDGPIAVSSQPFVLVLQSGERVRCLLGDHFDLERADLVAKRGATSSLGRSTRHLLHHVREGRSLFVEALLEREDAVHSEDYRGGVGKAWVARSTNQRPARVSTSPFTTSIKHLVTKHLEMVFLYFAMSVCLLAASLSGAYLLAEEAGSDPLSSDPRNIAITVIGFALVTAFILALTTVSTRLKLAALRRENR